MPADFGRCRRLEECGGAFGAVGDQDTGVAVGFGIDADDRLAVQVLGDVRHEPVLADGDDDVFWAEHEAVEVGPLQLASSPVERDGVGDGRHRSVLGVVAAFDLVEVPASTGEEEPRLLTGAVPGKQIVELGAAVDKHRPRCERHWPCSGTNPAPRRAKTGVSRSGVRFKVPILGRLAANSLAASAKSIAMSASR